jgi:hypothetical protein
MNQHFAIYFRYRNFCFRWQNLLPVYSPLPFRNELTIIDKVFSGINSTQTSVANNEEINNAVVNNGNYDKMSIPIEKNDTNEILLESESKSIPESWALDKISMHGFKEFSNSPFSQEIGEFSSDDS